MGTILDLNQFLHNTFVAHDALLRCEVSTLSQSMHYFAFFLLINTPSILRILVFLLHCNYDLLFVFLGCN